MRFGSTVFAACVMAASLAAYANGWMTLFYSAWPEGIDQRIKFQRPTENAICVVNLSGIGKAIKVTITRNGDYAGVANGVPRAEISFEDVFRFRQGREYLVKWQTYIPPDYEFDHQQADLIAQIHQGPSVGNPTFSVSISDNGKYAVRNKTQSPNDAVSTYFGNASDDVGHLVNWELRYIPDGSGGSAVSELLKDGKLVFATRGVPNAYENDNAAFLKLGLYKADWLKKPSSVNIRTMYYGRVSVQMLN